MTCVDPKSGFCQTIANSGQAGKLIDTGHGDAKAREVIARTGYDSKGAKQWAAAARNPVGAVLANAAKDAALKDTKAQYPDGSTHNNAPDAYRHADWSVRMTRTIGEEGAKSFGDAHEAQAEPNNPMGEKAMDLMNNNNARVLSGIFPNMSPSSIASEAVKNGVLQTDPVVDPK